MRQRVARHELQLQLPFDDSTPAFGFPEAVLNDVGVMVENVIHRRFTGRRKMYNMHDHVVITMGHLAGVWSFGVSIRAGHSYSGFAPSKKWNQQGTLEECFSAAVELALDRLASMSKDRDSCVARSADDLMHLVHTGQHVESVIGVKDHE